MSAPPVDTELYNEVAYVHDGSLEGVLSAVFEAYARHERPSDVVTEGLLQLRFSQRIHRVQTDAALAQRVRAGVVRRCGERAFRQITRASVSSAPDTGMAIYRFIRYAMDEHAGDRRAISNIAHPAVARLFEIERGVSNECEKMRQFARFEHLQGEDVQVWFAKVNPRDAVVPLVLGHFVERFNVQPFILYDEVHEAAGVWDGQRRYLVDTAGMDMLANLPERSASEVSLSEAWRAFYRSVSVDARYNPELRQHFMPQRFWKNLTEMQQDVAALRR